MTRKVSIPGYEFKDGKIVRKKTYLDVSAKLRQKGSKRVRVVKTEMTMSSLNWYVIRTIPTHRIEFEVLRALHQREHQAMVPFYEELRPHPRTKRIETRKSPHFVGYVMAAFTGPQEFSHTKATVNDMFEARGKRAAIINLIGPSPERPWTLRADDVAFLQTLSVEKPSEVSINRAIKVGDEFRALDGPYQGHPATLVSVDKKRIKAMLMMFGQMMCVEMPITTTVVAA